MNPTMLLGLASALFVAPAIYLLTAFMRIQQGPLGGATTTASAEIVIWCVGVGSLLVPFAFPRLLRSSPDSVRLILALVFSVVASVFGVVLTVMTGQLAPVCILAPASMLAILGWSWTFRRCFESEALCQIIPRYTKVLVFIASISLLSVVLRVALWERIVDVNSGDVSSVFMGFLHLAVGIAALVVVRLRKLGSPYARSTTQVLSWALLLIPPLGSLVAIYWLFAVRRRELTPDPGAT